MKSQYVENLESGNTVESVFAVTSKSVPMKYKQKSGMWFSLEVSDKTGKISVKYWGGPDESSVQTVFDSFAVGDIISITGLAQHDNYANALVISIDAKNGHALQKSDFFDADDFIPVTDKNMEDMVLQLQETIEEIQNPDIKNLVKSFFDDPVFVEKYSKAPAAMTRHHNYVGGLLEHVLNMIQLAKTISSQYNGKLDLDLLVAGCIFHDIGKIVELEVKSAITYSVAGDLLGHISIGAKMVQDKIDSFDTFPEVLKNKIIHLILSHHGSLEFGSPVEPMFPEAVALNRIDECDSKIQYALQLKQEAISVTGEDIVRLRSFGKMYLK